jgi:2-(1,2-epoxy-1,2-dihydrophenyl)acetyl-CoA isomerase
MSSLAILTIEGRVARIALNRPEKLNSLTAQLYADLRAALDIVQATPGLACLVLSGAGKAFCAGQDLNERKRAPGEGAVDIGQTLDRDMNPLIARLRNLPFPVVAAVNGAAAGGGASLALAADIVLAARSAKFSFGFCKIGLMPDGGATWILPRLVGPARASYLVMTGKAITGEEAAAMGLVSAVFDDDALMAETDSLAAYFSAQPAAALAATKRALAASLTNSLVEQMQLERDTQRELGFSADYREGVDAFLNRRTPVFGQEP